MNTYPMRRAEISIPAIRHNVHHVRELTGGTVIAVVKADGYGHGAEIAARAALEGGAALLGVTDIDEALQLRAAGIDAPILCWLHGSRASFDTAIAHRIEIGVSLLAQLEAVAAAAQRLGTVAVVQFKVDTGLSRNGSSQTEWAELFARGAQLQHEGLVHIRGIFSHLANAGDHHDLAQAKRFDEAVAAAREAGIDPELIHIAASAAVFTSPHLHYNTVRVGLAIYGLSAVAEQSSADLGLIPAMTLTSEIVMLRTVPPGSGISYGFTHTAEAEMTLGLVPIGYADGLPRTLSGHNISLMVAGQKVPIVGRIGMDQCIVDVSQVSSSIAIGDTVTLFGDPLTAAPSIDTWARGADTINYEIAVSIGARVERIAVDQGSVRHTIENRVAPARANDRSGIGRDASARSGNWQIEVPDPEAMHDVGCTLGAQLAAGDLVILTGPLGAGKTTLTRGIGEGLGVRGPITSPTFVLARTHPSLQDGPPLVHVDAYRLSNPAEADDLDLDFESSVVVAEWGRGLISESGSWLEITIQRPEGASELSRASAEPDEELVEARTLTITGHGPRWAQSELHI